MPPYVVTGPGDLPDEQVTATEALLKAQQRRVDEAALTAEDLRIARLVHGLVKEEIGPHVARLERVMLSAGITEKQRKWLDLAIEREGRREESRKRIMQHSTMGLVWMFIAALAAMMWEGFKHAVRLKGS